MTCPSCREKITERYRTIEEGKFILHAESYNDNTTCDICDEDIPFAYFLTVYRI